jgi:PAS domain-containing protein
MNDDDDRKFAMVHLFIPISIAVIIGMIAGKILCRAGSGKRSGAGFESLARSQDLAAVTADSNGWITEINPAAKLLLGLEDEARTPFFDYFPATADKGQTIQRYVDLADGRISGTLSILLKSPRDGGKVHPASVMRLAAGTRRGVIAFIHPELISTPPLAEDV